jgi:hypothetical protein
MFVMGAVHGINFWLLFFIARQVINKPSRVINNAIAFLVALIGMYGPNVYPGMGSLSNDNLVSIFVLLFVLLQIKYLKNLSASSSIFSKLLIRAGIMLGIAAGLKLTTGIFLIGGVVAALALPVSFSDRGKILLTLGASAATGMLISSGYWMLQMWQQHHNPVFPFLNNIFHSPDYALTNWRDIRFMPQGIWQHLFYPFYFSWNGSVLGNAFRDFRFMFVYVLLILAGLNWLWQHNSKRWSGAVANVQPATSLPVYWLISFFIFSYIVWQCYISYARYYVPLEMLAPLVIYLLLNSIIRKYYYAESAFLYLGTMLILYMYPCELVRAPWYESTYFNVRFPSIVANTPAALTLTPYPLFLSSKSYINHNPRPQTYLVPMFPAQWRFIGVPVWNEQYFADTTTDTKINSLVHQYSGRIFLLAPQPYMPKLYKIVKNFDLTPDGKCEQINSDRQDMTHENLWLCPVRLTKGYSA